MIYSGHTDTDKGAFLRNGIKSLHKLGYCSEKSWPYDEGKFKVKPPKVCYDEAEEHKISKYMRLQNIDDMKHCLADGYPFVFGFDTYHSFGSKQASRP